MLLALVGLLCCGVVHADGEQRAVAARFTVSVAPTDGRSATMSTTVLDLWRNADRIETARAGHGEVWTRDGEGIHLTRVFHADRHLVHYAAGELKAMEAVPEWRTLASMVDAGTFAATAVQGATSAFGRTVEIRTGRRGADAIVLWWLPELAIPVRFERSGPRGTLLLVMDELREAPDAAWSLVGDEVYRDYAGLDGADLGEMEDDPFVRKLHAMDRGTRFANAHANH